MFGGLFASVKNAYYNAKYSAVTISSEAPTFFGATIIPTIKGIVETTAIVAAKASIHVVRFGYDAIKGIRNIAVNLFTDPKPNQDVVKVNQADLKLAAGKVQEDSGLFSQVKKICK